MKKYESPTMEIIAFRVKDIVTTSDPDVLPPTEEEWD